MFTEGGFLNLYSYEPFMSSALYLRPISPKGFGYEFYSFVTDRQQMKDILFSFIFSTGTLRKLRFVRHMNASTLCAYRQTLGVCT
jgi:hypothetical protein